MPAQLPDVLAPEGGRGPDGKFLPGVSGNPKGRPLGTKNHIAQLKLQLEAAVRENLNPTAVRKILNVMADKAISGDVAAAKLILDKLISNARESEDSEAQSGTFVFQVRNLTLKTDQPEGNIIDVTPIKESSDERE